MSLCLDNLAFNILFIVCDLEVWILKWLIFLHLSFNQVLLQFSQLKSYETFITKIEPCRSASSIFQANHSSKVHTSLQCVLKVLTGWIVMFMNVYVDHKDLKKILWRNMWDACSFIW